MSRVAVIGSTGWGTTLAIVIAQKGIDVALWVRTPEEAADLGGKRENVARLPGFGFPHTLTVTPSLDAALHGVEMAILAVPAQRMRENLRSIAPRLPPGCVVMSAAKGLELETCLRMSEVMREELPPQLHDRCCVLSGPNLSREVAQGMPAATVIASEDKAVAAAARDLVMTPRFRVYSSYDVVGVELGGALKNIIALGAGLNDGWGYGANSKAAFMTRGLAEITRLGVAAGANPLTFLGLAGLGDLVATCTSPLSRNRIVGEALARGRPLAAVLGSLQGTAEGVATTPAARELGRRLGVEMPIVEEAYKVLYEGMEPRRAIMELMTREPRFELDGLGVS